MRCPSCHRPVDHEASSCYSCGYSLRDAVAKFGANQVAMRRVHDAADCLRVDEARELSRMLDRMEERFPQILFTAYLGELNDTIAIGELGFWLLNHANIETTGKSRTNDCAILLLLDVEKKRLGISLGYLTEMLLSPEDCHRALVACRADFMNGEFGSGVMTFFRKIEKLLLKQAKKMKGLTRHEKQQLLIQNHHGLNTLALPPRSFPVPGGMDDEFADGDDNEPFEHLLFRNEFEGERK